MLLLNLADFRRGGETLKDWPNRHDVCYQQTSVFRMSPVAWILDAMREACYSPLR
jgi:hypothetical protein